MRLTASNEGTEMELTLTTTSVSQTHNLGEVLGQSISGPLVIALTGDLGSGKTVFVQGLARGLAVPGEYYVTSPSYTLINEYPGHLTLYHVDLYRLTGRVDLEDLELLDIVNGNGVVAIEWADRLVDDLPAEHVRIHFEISGNDRRKIRITAHGLEPLNLLKGFEKSL